MQYINQQDLFNTARSRKYQAILYDLRSKIEFDKFRLIKSWNLDVNSINKDLSLVKQSQSASKEFLKVVYGWQKVENRGEVNVYLIWDKNTETPLKDIYSIFSNCIAPSRIFALDVDFDTFKQKYSVICSSSADAKQKGKTLCRFPNEIIPNLFLGGYNDADEMMVILQELKITHVLNCAREFTSGIPNDEKQEYKIPNGVVVNHIKMIDQPRQQIKFNQSYNFIESSLNKIVQPRQLSPKPHIIKIEPFQTKPQIIIAKQKTTPAKPKSFIPKQKTIQTKPKQISIQPKTRTTISTASSQSSFTLSSYSSQSPKLLQNKSKSQSQVSFSSYLSSSSSSFSSQISSSLSSQSFSSQSFSSQSPKQQQSSSSSSSSSSLSQSKDSSSVQQPRVFVHCHEGVSRSASVVIGYLMDKYKLTVIQSHDIVHHQRHIILPNCGFMKQLYLKEYQNVDKYGKHDKELKKLIKHDNDPINQIEIDLGKVLTPQLKIQDLSHLPVLNEIQQKEIRCEYYNSFIQAQYEWNAKKLVKIRIRQSKKS